jgi:hypothetical protein
LSRKKSKILKGVGWETKLLSPWGEKEFRPRMLVLEPQAEESLGAEWKGVVESGGRGPLMAGP